MNYILMNPYESFFDESYLDNTFFNKSFLAKWYICYHQNDALFH